MGHVLIFLLSASFFHYLLPITFAFRFLCRSDSVTISIWNSRKVHKRQGAGFLGCVRLNPSSVHRLKDTGCEFL